jgi:hypothetical protein
LRDVNTVACPAKVVVEQLQNYDVPGNLSRSLDDIDDALLPRRSGKVRVIVVIFVLQDTHGDNWVSRSRHQAARTVLGRHEGEVYSVRENSHHQAAVFFLHSYAKGFQRLRKLGVEVVQEGQVGVGVAARTDGTKGHGFSYSATSAASSLACR